MEKLKTLWFKLVAPSLLKHIEDVEDHYNTILDAYVNQTRELNEVKLKLCVEKERAKVENRDGAIAVQVIRERMREQNPCILAAHERGAKQRINELEVEVSRLKKQISGLRK